jgi:hypothetical protein
MPGAKWLAPLLQHGMEAEKAGSSGDVGGTIGLRSDSTSLENALITR